MSICILRLCWWRPVTRQVLKKSKTACWDYVNPCRMQQLRKGRITQSGFGLWTEAITQARCASSRTGKSLSILWGNNRWLSFPEYSGNAASTSGANSFEFARLLVPSGSRAAAGAVCPLPVASITVSPQTEIWNDRKGQIETQSMPNYYAE